MRPIDHTEYPQELQPVLKKAKRLEWLTAAYLISTAAVVYVTMGTSQAMKTAWFEDVISLTPSISFLIASRLVHKTPNKDFPYGFHRVASIAYLCSAVALFSVGSFLIVDSAITLLKQEHTTIGITVIFGHEIWAGYPMIVAMLYGTFPAMVLGRKKLPLADKLHEKNLYTDAKMNKADWMTAAAAILGVLGIGMGWWWADAAAALVISFDILKDGYTNLRQSVFDLLNERPKTVDEQKDDPLLQKVEETLQQQPWVKAHAFRLREEGHIYLGEAYVVPHHEANLVPHIEQLAADLENLHWRIQEVVVMPVRELPEQEIK